jgi:signal peptidase I
MVIAPYAIRNYGLNGSLLPTRGGRNLFIANSEYVVLPQYGPDILGGFAQTILAQEGLDGAPPSPGLERQQDALLARHAIAEMKRRPFDTLWRKAAHVGYFFSPRLVPYHEPTPQTRIVLGEHGAFSVENSPVRSRVNQWAYAAPYAFVVVMAAMGLRARRRDVRRDAILWCIALTFVAVHALYFPTTRYRVPMEFVLLFYAALGLDAIAATRRASSRAPVFLDLCEQLLGDGRSVRFCAEGTSMRPSIQDGDRLTVDPVDPASVQPGDIILYHHRQRPIVHRVVAVRQEPGGRTAIVVRGDGKAADDAPIDPGQILGKIVAIEPRPGSVLSVQPRR